MESGLRQGSCAALAPSLAFAAGSALCVAQKGVTGVTDTTVPVSPSTSSGKYYARVVGISGYTVLPELATPANDAREVAAVLSGQYGFTTQLLIDSSRDRKTGDYDVDNIALGLKFNAWRRLLLIGNVTIKLNNRGLRANVVPLVGVSYTF